MSINFAIECRHCGAHTIVESYVSCRTMRNIDENRTIHIDTQCAIRCPNCRSRLNTSEEEFLSQVTVMPKS